MPVHDDKFRTIAASLAGGVTIVTATDGSGAPRGLTSSAVCSVSAHPPAMLVCVDESSNTLSAIRDAGAFAINVLAAGRQDLALRFASKAHDKFSDVAWEPSQVANGVPILVEDAVACAECVVIDEFRGGDHWIFLGRVEGGFARDDVPLLYCRRTFAAWPQAGAIVGSDA